MTEHPHPQPKHRDMTGPILLIGLGIILLLHNIGYIHFNLWSLIRLWPIFIIAAGLEVLLGKRSRLTSLISGLVIVALLIGGVWMLGQPTDNPLNTDTIHITAAHNDFSTARVQLSPAIAQLNISHLLDSDNFVEGTVTHEHNEDIYEHFTEGDPARLLVKAEEHTGIGDVFNDQPRQWDFKFHRDVALDLTTDLGIGEANLDLAHLTLGDAKIDFGIGQLTLSLPDDGDYKVNIDGGIGNIHIQVPYGASVRINTDTGIVGRTMPGNYHRRNNVYTSPNYNEADTHITLNLDLGIGRLTVTENRGE